MRLTCLLTVLLAFSATASVNAQQGKVTIDVKSATLSQVLMEVKDQTGAKILYNENLLRDVECKDLKLEGVAVEEALNQILAHTPLIPQKRGIINKPGIKNNNCRERDRKMETLALPIDWKKLVITIWAPTNG